MALPGVQSCVRALLLSTKPGSCLARNHLNCRLLYITKSSRRPPKKCIHGTIYRHFSVSRRAFRRVRPHIFYLQNPVVWLNNRWDFLLLKSQWDPTFSLSDFQKGCKQALCIITQSIAAEDYNQLTGLIEAPTLKKLQTEVASAWKNEQRLVVGLQPDHVHVVLPHRVFLKTVVDDRYCDVDMILMGFKPTDTVSKVDINVGLLIEAAARFHRNYTVGILPDWTVTRIHLQSRDVQIKTKSRVL